MEHLEDQDKVAAIIEAKVATCDRCNPNPIPSGSSKLLVAARPVLGWLVLRLLEREDEELLEQIMIPKDLSGNQSSGTLL